MISKAISQYKRSFLVGLFAASLGFAVEVETSLFNTINNTSLFLTQATGIGVNNNPNEAASPCLNLQLNCEQVTRTTADENDGISSNLPIVLTIDQTEFDSQLFGISPIDRCYMAEKIKLIAPDAKLLFIDYDVSPLVNPNPEYTQCQNSLDQVLDYFGEKLVLIEPLVNQENQLKHQWKNARQANGVTFAAANLNKQFGFVVEQSSLSNSVARTVYSKTEDNELPESGLIDFNHLNIEELKTTSLKNRIVFLGGTYGFEDRHTSPWGSGTHGIHLQALDYASYLYPVTTGGQGEWKVNLIDYGLDLAIAFIVLLIMGSIWTGYHKWRMPIQGRCKNELAFVFVIIALVVFGVLAMLAAILTGWILIDHQIWIEPIPIMLGIFIDGIINREPIESSNTDEKPAKCREDSCLHLCWCLIKSLPGALWRLFKSLLTPPQKLWSWLINSIASKLWHPIETFKSLVEPFKDLHLKDLHRIKKFKIAFMIFMIIYYPWGYTLFGEIGELF